MTTEQIPIEEAAAEGYLSMSQAARALGLSKDTVRKMVDTGRLRACRSALGRLVDPASVAELVELRNAR